MYKVQPRGINIKDNERTVPDGFLKESINLQWKDGSYRPIPERLLFDDSLSGVVKIIMHKTSDEDQINILAFNVLGALYWAGDITDGIYTSYGAGAILISDFPTITDFDSLSFTILNGLVYFMSSSQEFYYRVQYNETDGTYEVKDMYAWKSLIPYYPMPNTYAGAMVGAANFLITQCGIILIRFTLVLNTGEEVLHTPIYPYYMYAINTQSATINKGDALTNIHTLVNTNLDFADTALLDEEVSAINMYASIPVYQTKVNEKPTTSPENQKSFSSNDAKGEIQRLAEEPFYLVKTLEKPGADSITETVVFYAGEIDSAVFYYTSLSPVTKVKPSKINTDTIASGSVMPVDNFSYHKIYGTITSANGRLLIGSPKTVLSNGHIRALSLNKSTSKVGYYINTEDGDLEGVAYDLDTEVKITGTAITSRGLLSYPDARATYVGGNVNPLDSLLLYKTRGNKAHNMACAFNFDEVEDQTILIGISGLYYIWTLIPVAKIIYNDADLITPVSPPTIDPLYYDSNNRIQFSEVGEFSVFPALNSYRVGEGKIVFVGSNSIDPANTDYISPLLIGTSDGIYTANFDPTGQNLIQSITRAAKLPALSDKNVVIDQNLIYLSDIGLIVINNGEVVNITKDFFPERGSGDFPDNNTVYPNYNTLTSDLSGTDYQISDIVEYMKGALFAYDGRRNNVWFSNPDEDFSLIYNTTTNQWTMSTFVFNQVINFDSTLTTSEGDIYSRYLVRNADRETYILSGEDTTQQVYTHLLTRGIKIGSADQYKKIQRLISRCELYRDDANGKFSFGVWGKQDINKDKVNIPLIALEDSSSDAFPSNIRQDIPVGRMKGKYKLITILQGGYLLPKSSIDIFEIVAIPVDNNILR